MKILELVISLMLLIILMQSCKKVADFGPPITKTGIYYPMSQVVVGQITYVGPGISEYGHVWNTDTVSPTILSGDRTIYVDANSNSGDTIPIISYLDNILPDKTYYIRSYAVDPWENVFYADRVIEYDSSFNPPNGGNIVSACFTASRTQCQIGDCYINFNGSCSENAISYKWDVDGDGIYDYAGLDKQSINHNYDETGTYIARLEICSIIGTCYDTTQTIEVLP